MPPVPVLRRVPARSRLNNLKSSAQMLNQPVAKVEQAPAAAAASQLFRNRSQKQAATEETQSAQVAESRQAAKQEQQPASAVQNRQDADSQHRNLHVESSGRLLAGHGEGVIRTSGDGTKNAANEKTPLPMPPESTLKWLRQIHPSHKPNNLPRIIVKHAPLLGWGEMNIIIDIFSTVHRPGFGILLMVGRCFIQPFFPHFTDSDPP